MDNSLKNEEKKILGVYLNCKTRKGKMDVSFDYSSTETNNISFFVDKSLYFAESKLNDIVVPYSNQSKIQGSNELLLFKIIINNKDNKYKIKLFYKIPLVNFNFQDCLWYVINSNSPQPEERENDDYILKENDLLKIGQYKYIVREINFAGRGTQIQTDKFVDISPPLKDVKKCEYCENLTVNLCKCKNEYVHIDEFKKWVKDNCKERQKRKVKNYYFSMFHCEEKLIPELKKENNENKICNTYYPLQFKYKINNQNNEANKDNKEKKDEYKVCNLFEFEIPKEKEYMILESLPEKDINQNSNKIVKSVHIVELTKGDEIKIGRDEKKNDIIIDDVTVSSEHALIKYDINTGNLILKSLKNHFGTLVLVNPDKENKLLEIKEKPIFFQSNRTFFEVRLMSEDDALKCSKNENIIFL